MRSDLDIARDVTLRPIEDVASEYGFDADGLEPYGRFMAKVDHKLAAEPGAAKSRYVVVTAITPTPAGEGKTVHTVGLSLALNKLGKKAACAIRQPSMGPVFGIKGGAAGGKTGEQ